MCAFRDKRADKEHWAEYINFLHEFPCMVKEESRNDELWCNLSNRLNKINDCKKSTEKWKESIRNWRRNAIRKHEDAATLNDSEKSLIKLIKTQNNKKCIGHLEDKQMLVTPNIVENIQININPQKQRNGQNKIQQQMNGNLVKPNYDTKLVFPQEFVKTSPLTGIQHHIGNAFRRNQQPLLQPLNIYYQNVRGLRTKLEKFSSAVLQQNYDVIVLTETWLLPAIASHRVFDDRYFVFRTDRSVLTSEKSIGGGVLIAVLKTHGSIKRHLTNGAVEEVWISLVNYRLVICAVYFPPRTPESKFKEFLRSANILNSNNNGIILGDFNMRRITWLEDKHNNLCIPTDVTVESFKTLLEGLKLLGVQQRNHIINSTGVILDLVYTNTNAISITLTNSPFVFPDYHHPPLKISLPLNKGEPTGG